VVGAGVWWTVRSSALASVGMHRPIGGARWALIAVLFATLAALMFVPW
jgi:hypothetical protein